MIVNTFQKKDIHIPPWFIDVENQIHKLTDPEEISLFAYFINDYMEKHKPLNKYLAKVSETPITADVKFLFKDPM